MKYSNPKSYTKDEINSFIKANSTCNLIEAIISESLYSEDREFAKELAINQIFNQNIDVVKASIKGLWHIARIDKNLNKRQIFELLDNLENKDCLRGEIDDLLDDINIFSGS